MKSEQRFVSHSPDRTWKIADAVVQAIHGKGVIALYGELGSGKTCFVQGAAVTLGVKQAVTSPTFTIINEYQGARPLYHIDLYRMRHPDEILALGFENYLESDGVTAIEWAERAGDLIPSNAVHVHMEALDAPDERHITIISEAHITIASPDLTAG